MDVNTDIAEVQSGNSELHSFRLVTPITLNLTEAEDAKKLNELWNLVRTQEYAFDDTSRGNATAFLQWFLDPHSLHFYVGEKSGYIVMRNMYPGQPAQAGFVVWDHNLGMTNIKAAAQEVVDYVLNNLKFHRIDAYIPSYNKFAKRVATGLRFRFEGARREAVRFGGRWHDVEIYGLLNNSQKDDRVQ